ncbi:MAG: flagellar biosynthetic protein FliO [Solirubrobacterales bacterium]
MSLPLSPLLAVATAHGESQPLDLSGSSTTAHAASGGSIARTIVGLAIVLLVIFGLRWVMKQYKAGREKKAAGTGLASMATLPLGQNRSLHVVRAGREVLVVGSGEHGVTPVRSYSEEEARALGLLEIGFDDEADDDAEAQKPLKMKSDGPSEGAAAGPITVGQFSKKALETLRGWTVRG